MFDFNTEFQTMMELHNLDTVVILGHMNPDGDAAGSVMGLAHYIKINFPQFAVYPYLSDKLDKGPKKQVNADRIFEPFVKPDMSGCHYGVIVCDTATKARMIGLDLYEDAAMSIVIDHHASNEGYGDMNYTYISESCAENVFFTLEEECLKRAAKEEYPNTLDYIYLGIIHDTDCFKRARKSTFAAAGKLLELGVDHNRILKTKQTDTMESLKKRSYLWSQAVLALDGKVAYVVIDRLQRDEQGISYEDIHTISDTLRDCEDIELSFTMYEEDKDLWRCSFRSDGKWIDVNKLITPFGGGGHAGAAGLRIHTKEQKKLLDDILDAVRSRI